MKLLTERGQSLDSRSRETKLLRFKMSALGRGSHCTLEEPQVPPFLTVVNERALPGRFN